MWSSLAADWLSQVFLQKALFLFQPNSLFFLLSHLFMLLFVSCTLPLSSSWLTSPSSTFFYHRDSATCYFYSVQMRRRFSLEPDSSVSSVSLKPEVSVATKVDKHISRRVEMCVWLTYGVSGASGEESRTFVTKEIGTSTKSQPPPSLCRPHNVFLCVPGNLVSSETARPETLEKWIKPRPPEISLNCWKLPPHSEGTLVVTTQACLTSFDITFFGKRREVCILMVWWGCFLQHRSTNQIFSWTPLTDLRAFSCMVCCYQMLQISLEIGDLK